MLRAVSHHAFRQTSADSRHSRQLSGGGVVGIDPFTGTKLCRSTGRIAVLQRIGRGTRDGKGARRSRRRKEGEPGTLSGHSKRHETQHRPMLGAHTREPERPPIESWHPAACR